MAFSKLTNSSPYVSATTQPKLDESQLGKLSEAGYQVTPVSTNPSVVSSLQPTVKTVMPGTTVGGYQDTAGNFYVVGEDNKVHNVAYFGPNLDTNVKPATEYPGKTDYGPGGSTYTPPTSPGGFDIPPTLPPPAPPASTPLPPPPGNFGSGKIFTAFQSGDIVPNQQETVTRALWSGNVGNLLTFYTSSSQTSTQKRYYYEVFNSASGDCGSEAQFSVAYGHKLGSGSADEGGQITDTPSAAIYGQYRLLCLDAGTERFTIDGTTTDDIYAINVNRARMREYLDEGNLELNLAHLSGSGFMSLHPVNAHTGSNVRVKGNSAVLRLVDDSRINSATVTEAGEVYQMVSGSIEDGVYNSSAPHVYGLMYRRLGIIVLDARRLDMSASFLTVTGSEVAGDNAYKLFTAISGAALYQDTSGDYKGFAGRSAEKVKSTHFFCRVKNAEYNFSNNPSFTTGSEGDLAEPTFIGNPTVYVTTVGLYNDRKELIAVAKLSKALKKTFTREALIKVKLDF
jgi:hypothetical protein